MTLACLASQFCTELGPAQPRLVPLYFHLYVKFWQISKCPDLDSYNATHLIKKCFRHMSNWSPCIQVIFLIQCQSAYHRVSWFTLSRIILEVAFRIRTILNSAFPGLFQNGLVLWVVWSPRYRWKHCVWFIFKHPFILHYSRKLFLVCLFCGLLALFALVAETVGNKLLKAKKTEESEIELANTNAEKNLVQEISEVETSEDFNNVVSKIQLGKPS